MPEAVRNVRATATETLASARCALRRLPATDRWLWLVRSGAFEATAPIGLVLLDRLPELLVAIGAEVFRRG